VRIKSHFFLLLKTDGGQTRGPCEKYNIIKTTAADAVKPAQGAAVGKVLYEFAIICIIIIRVGPSITITRTRAE